MSAFASRAWLGGWFAWLIAASAASGADPSGLAFFEQKVRPVLVKECYGCHSTGAKAVKGGLRLDSRDGLRAGGESGPAVVPGKPDESLILEALRFDGIEMPPKGKLPESVVADFQRWVEMGAPDPRDGKPAPLRSGIDIAAGRKFWSYQPPHRHDPPVVRDAGWPRSEIDRFILAALEARQLTPTAVADRATLIRRLSYDLIGLPPTVEECAAFVNDPSPDATERLVDRLLASPGFGERWGRHWLDVARFGESLTLRGFVMKEAWRYRDYVIDAFNSGMPFDQFLREQIAGDLLFAGTREERRRQWVATTFLVLGNTNLEDQDKAQLRMDVVDEQLDTIGKAVLAQTLGCARCHDHKFDPIPTRDYYALAGIFRNVKTLEHANVSKWLEQPLPETPEREAVHKRNEDAVAVLEGRLKAVPKGDAGKDERRAIERELWQHRLSDPRRDMVMTVVEESKIGDTRVHIRGSVHNLGEPVPRGFLQVATEGTVPPFSSGESGRRELADWLASEANPLTARVIVNRVWHWLFGAGLVRTTDNFGTTGETPSHPELLDDLAVRFMEEGWSLKRLVRRIVLSRVYQLGLTADPRLRAADPENRLLGRRERKRLDAECLRDTILMVSCQLQRPMGGRTFPADLEADYGYKAAEACRSVYVPVFRNALPDLFEVFDFADPSLVIGRRDVSTVAPQALCLMNHPFLIEQSRLAARRLLAESGNDASRLDRAYRMVLGRPPSAAERRIGLEFVRNGPPEDAWATLVHALFASLDFRSVS